MEVTASFTARQRSAFAIQHLMAAARFSYRCGEIQREYEGKLLGSFFDEQIACTSATVMLCMASLESNINEYLIDPDKLFPDLKKYQATEFVELIDGLSILENIIKPYQLKDVNRFLKGRGPIRILTHL